MRVAVVANPGGELLLPNLVVRDAVVEVVVIDAQQPGLLQVRRGDPPAALLIAIDAVLEHVAQRLVGPALRAALDVRIRRVLLCQEGKRVEDRSGQRVVAQARVGRATDGLVAGRPGAS